MATAKNLELLQKQIDIANSLKNQEQFSPNFKKWKRDTEIVIQKTFGEDSRHINDFNKIRYSLSAYSSATPDSAFYQAYLRGIEEAKQVLASMIDEINEFGLPEGENKGAVSSLALIENLCNRFHLVARQVRQRHANRSTLEIEDEYDVQDLFHALLHLHFNDIRPEEWTPSYAGGSARVDFLLKEEQIIVEIKKTRKGMSTKELADQLLIDVARYKVHQDCKCLICFVYDPEGRIANPRGLENDLNKKHEDFEVILLITPKGI